MQKRTGLVPHAEHFGLSGLRRLEAELVTDNLGHVRVHGTAETAIGRDGHDQFAAFAGFGFGGAGLLVEGLNETVRKINDEPWRGRASCRRGPNA